MGFVIRQSGVDVSWPQGHYRPAPNDEFVIAAACSNDSGRMFVQSSYQADVDAARAAGRGVEHYFFNGPADPTAYANFCVDHLHDFGPNDPAWLDVETQSNRSRAYTPAEALAFGRQFKVRTGCMPGLYLNLSEVLGEDWSENVAAGQVLWLADYVSAFPQLRYWPEAVMWQHTSTPLDEDVSQYTPAEIRAMQNGASAVPALTLTAATITETDDLEMLSEEAQSFLGNLVAAAITKLADDIRRDARGRLYKNSDTGQYAIVRHNLPSNDPGKVILIPVGQEGDRVLAYFNYEIVGDSVDQAHPLDDAQFKSLLTLANGTDVAFRGTLVG